MLVPKIVLLQNDPCAEKCDDEMTREAPKSDGGCKTTRRTTHGGCKSTLFMADDPL